MIAEEKLKEIKELASKATPGPWKKGCAIAGRYMVDDVIEETKAACGPEHRDSDEDQEKKVIADARYISACRPEIIKEIIEEVLELRFRIEGLEK